MRGKRQEEGNSLRHKKSAIDFSEYKRVRFAPSPTGSLHIGSARVMLYNYLHARKNNGQVLVRIEDTDKTRSTKENEAEIFKMLHWLQLDYDESPVLQTDNEKIHQEALDKLIEEGKVYRCTADQKAVEEWKKENGKNKGFRGEDDKEGAYRLRLKNNQEVKVLDAIRGETVFNTSVLDDPIVARSDKTPVYNFAVALDDLSADVDLVIRGEDHLSNTPKQMLVIEALGKEAPLYAHLPLILGPDNKKLSKRHQAKDGSPLAISVEQLKDNGILPEAALSYLAQLGWGEEEERILSKEELIEAFDVTRVKPSPAHYDTQKLRIINGEWMMRIGEEELVKRASEYLDIEDTPHFRQAIRVLEGRAKTLKEIDQVVGYSWHNISIDKKAAKKFLKDNHKENLKEVKKVFENSEWSSEALEKKLTELAEKNDLKLKDVFQPIRVALTGRASSPHIGDTITLLDKNTAVQRIDDALSYELPAQENNS